MLIQGRQIALEIINDLKQKSVPKKFLAGFLVGNEPNSISFINQKQKTAKELGVGFRLYKYPDNIKNDELRKEVLKIVQHKTCGGALLQLPLPAHLNKHYVLNVIPREKDIDVLGERALGGFYTERNPVLPPAVGTVKKILEAMNYELGIRKVVVIGQGLLVGRPIAVWLMNKVSELAVFGSKTADLKNKLKNYDLVISGVGKAGIIKPEMLKPGAGIIDFGYESVGGEMLGDFDISTLKAKSCKLKADFYTPTPGGTGPILVAQLFENFYKLNGVQW